ncbi:hypothetical protein LCGC14_0757490 [marine sediment metagenome]|uniref:Uncharacterized protein n=1 Tax=marine sediment metagenome TaxID=412755 RepID=A0A0F9QM13_9ZZZZ
MSVIYICYRCSYYISVSIYKRYSSEEIYRMLECEHKCLPTETIALEQ